MNYVSSLLNVILACKQVLNKPQNTAAQQGSDKTFVAYYLLDIKSVVFKQILIFSRNLTFNIAEFFFPLSVAILKFN